MLVKLLINMVPGGGIEPPTRGFSVHCSTPELPGHGWNGRAVRVAQVLVAGRSQVQREFGCDSVWFCAAFAQRRGKLGVIIAAVHRPANHLPRSTLAQRSEQNGWWRSLLSFRQIGQVIMNLGSARPQVRGRVFAAAQNGQAASILQARFRSDRRETRTPAPVPSRAGLSWPSAPDPG